jgi:hypothetical protein
LQSISFRLGESARNPLATSNPNSAAYYLADDAADEPLPVGFAAGSLQPTTPKQTNNATKASFFI